MTSKLETRDQLHSDKLNINRPSLSIFANRYRFDLGEKDRTTMLPQKIVQPLKEHVDKVKIIHKKEFKNVFSFIYLSYAIE